MTHTEAETAKLRAQLTSKFHQLPPLEQKIIQLFSVIYEPMNRTLFMEMLNITGVRDANDKLFTIPTLKPYIDKLLADELLVQFKQGIRCHWLLIEIATRSALEARCFESMVKAVQLRIPIRELFSNGPCNFQNNDEFIREVRIGIYRQDVNFINKISQQYHEYASGEKIFLEDIFELVCNNPFDADWFRILPIELFQPAITTILDNATLNLSPAFEAFDLLRVEMTKEGGRTSGELYLTLLEQLILRGCFQEAEEIIERIADAIPANTAVFSGWLALLRGDIPQAIEHYTLAHKVLKKATNKQKVYFTTTGGLFFILALLKDGSPQRLREASEYISIMSRYPNHWLNSTYSQLQSFVQMLLANSSSKEFYINTYKNLSSEQHSIETFFSCLCLYWVDVFQAKNRLPSLLEQFYQFAIASGYNWLAMEAAELLSRLKASSSYQQQAQKLRGDRNIETLVELLKPQEPWELSLNALANLQKQQQVTTSTEPQSRLAWFIKYYPSPAKCVLEPREQKANNKGVWSKGRAISLRRLSENMSEFDYLTPQDIKVCACIDAYYGKTYYDKSEYTLNEKAMSALIGHPYVFWEDAPTTRVDIVRGEPELIVKKDKQEKFTLEFSHNLQPEQQVITVQETPTRIKVIEITADHRRIAEIIGKQNKLEVPAKAKEKVLAAISAVSGIMTVHSDIGGGLENVQEVPAQSIPHVHLLPAGEGLKVALLSRPFADGGSYYHPGAGGERVIAEIGGKRLQTRRNLKEEKQLANAVVAACPTFASQSELNSEWLVTEPEDCLSMLLELQVLGDSVIIEWPEGEKYRLTHRVDFQDLQLQIQRQGDWFSASGELKLDDSLVLDMQQLLALLEKSPSRFVPLGDGQFIALTQEFRKRLDELRSFAEKHGQGMRFHPLAAVTMSDWLSEVNLKADKSWREHVQRLREVQNLEPKLPSTLQAQLRDYQIDGFNWLVRLAHWGVGACLADQMGLGKTLQALAVILSRAKEGPSLIIAPTSVCFNWVSEAEKFTPTLNPVQFGNGDRKKILDKLQPFDMLVCSYGLLQQEEVAQMLSEVQWQTIVLDEAQSIKNFATKRSQSAMKLQGGFKLITTGTPVENNLSELWNLFRFINPGLLGSLESFNQRFAFPIEKLGDKQARNRLKKLIQPFLLRRTKNQVLEELPSRTEILLHVELSQEETALYEAMRREAIAKLANSQVEAGAKHLQVLAEIMKLRRACCNPKLVMPDVGISSSKLQLFGEVLGNLLENRHKALVFSQFVDHLQIIREYLDEQKIIYQYLDGSTPATERKKRVEAFQSGDGDVFLISLKAGGTGLNLTAADYVIHMDPWWNPAVEDQASDRAHRIGQLRPVTIYRLVAKDTIEDKIVDLHHYKRDLADSLLEGAEISGKMSTEELLNLMS